MQRIGRTALVFITTLLGVACGPPEAVTIHFAGVVGQQPFAFSSQYTGLGSTTTTWAPQDFRFYAHDFALIDSKGASVPLTLEQDGKWQTSNVALLDFEDATAGCANGTAEMNTEVVGHIPSGHTIAGLQFSIGVPENLDHLNEATAPSPLDLSGLFWSWMNGYVFLKVDGVTTGQPLGYSLHLGSSDCAVDSSGNTTTCQHPNRPAVHFATFDPEKNVVIADLAALLQGVNADVVVDPASPGCLSEQTDPDCAPIFQNLGLPFGAATNTAAQSFLRVQ